MKPQWMNVIWTVPTTEPQLLDLNGTMEVEPQLVDLIVAAATKTQLLDLNRTTVVEPQLVDLI